MADTKMVVKSKEDMVARFRGVRNAEYDFTDSTLIDYTYSAINGLTPPQIAKIDAILLTGPSGVGKNVYAEAFAEVFGARVYKEDKLTIDEDLDRYIFFTCMKSTSADNFFRVPDLDVIVNMQNINVSLKSGIEQTEEAISNHIKNLPLDELFATALEISSGDFVRLQNTVRFAINSDQDAGARESFSRIDRLTGAAIEAQKKKTGTSKALQDGAFRRAVKLANEGKNVVLHIDELDKDESGYAQQAIAGLLSSALITDGTKNGTLRLEEHAYGRLKIILTKITMVNK